MAEQPLRTVLHHIRRLVRPPADGAVLSDGQLLQSFAQTGEQAAFQTLLERHGPMVLGVCRRLLADANDAEDAFQATFLVLIRKAGSLTMWGSLASWLYGVACRTALKAGSEAARRRFHERRAAEMPRAEARSEPAASELRHVLDEELSHLPEKYRAPLVLCYLEGKTNEEAARVLSWPAGSMSRRLAKGRDLLRKRLLRRGVGLSSGAIATVVAESAAPAAVSSALAQATLQAACLMVTGHALGVAKSTAVLLESVLKQMAYSKVKSAVGLLLLVCLVGAGAAMVTNPFWPAPPPAESPRVLPDPLAEPLPPGAVARLGTSRWWQPGGIHTLRLSPDGRLLVTDRLWGLPFEIRAVATGKQLPSSRRKTGQDSTDTL